MCRSHKAKALCCGLLLPVAMGGCGQGQQQSQSAPPRTTGQVTQSINQAPIPTEAKTAAMREAQQAAAREQARK
jgi:hypothetical protein